MRFEPLIFAGIPSPGGFVKNVGIITIESDFGAGKKGAKLGPAALLKSLPENIIENIPVQSVKDEGLEEDPESTYALHIQSISEVQQQAVAAIAGLIEKNVTPWIISGDHSNGLAAITAYKTVYPQNRLGVIWIDAHADLHTPYTTPTGNMHGMPLGAALGLGKTENSRNNPDKLSASLWKNLSELKDKKGKSMSKLRPEDLIFIGIRDLEQEEIDIIQQQNIRSFNPVQIKETGIQALIIECLEHLKECNHILVSFDVDSMDPSVSSGTGTPVHQGLSREQTVELLSGLLSTPNLYAFEVTEINPLLDRIQPMEIAAAGVLEEVFKNSNFLA